MSGVKNNFGCLRLLLAGMVIIGHEPEFIDGNRHHEPMTMLFHSGVSLGDLAVTCFFLISGYLITKSAFTTSSHSQYISNRVRRILPGYVVAYLICVFVLAPFVGGAPLEHLTNVVGKFVAIEPPPYFPGMLSSIRYGDLDNAMWTIAYEFRCYMLVIALFAVGVLQRRRTMLMLTISLLTGSVAAFCLNGALDGVPKWWGYLFGVPSQTLRLLSAFFVGSCFYLYWPELKDRLTTRAALTSAAALVALLFVSQLAHAAIAVFGSVVLFWLALKADLGVAQRINDRWDISYGVYLYGWPTGVTILYFNRHASAWVLTPITLMVAMVLGAISWYVVEKPMRRAKVSALDSANAEMRLAA